MIILKLTAGLGNQMFQYAYARSLALENETDFKIDLWWYKNQSKRDTQRTYGLSDFNIQEIFAEEKETSFYHSSLYQIYNKIKKNIDRRILKRSDFVYYKPKSVKNAYVEGFWNSEQYFKKYEDTIRKELSLKTPLGKDALLVSDTIREANSSGKCTVLIHVRRGDYVLNPHANKFHGVKDTDYFNQALDVLKEKLVGQGKETDICFFVVSDDIAWAKENLMLDGSSTTFISRPEIKDYEEIHLMSLCQNFIISNSTFSWWGAWLSSNKNKIVIGPKQWVNNPDVDTKDVMPPEWIHV